MELTYGLELEWADVDRHAELPCGRWSSEDYTIVNSDGHANDPTGETWRWGGEINTDPTDTIQGQLDQVRELAMLLNPTINYRCNLHCHVGGFPITLANAKQLLRYITDRPRLLDIIEPIPKPRPVDYLNRDAFNGAMARYRRRLVSHHHRLPEARVTEALQATTLDQFHDAHAPLSKAGRRMWPIAPRPGINLRSLREHGTIEFRHFPGSADPLEIAHALDWCVGWTEHALGDGPIEALIGSRRWRFPQFRPYDHDLELGYRSTKLGP